MPLLVAYTPDIVRWILPPGHIVEVVAVLLVPVMFALIRAHIGTRQLAQACGGEPTLGRQFTLGIAIVFLLLFDGYSIMLQFVNDEPASAWLVAIALYVVYFVTIMAALRASPSNQAQCGNR